MSEAIVRAAFETRLLVWAAGQTPPLPVALENVAFTPVTGVAYLRTFILPARTISLTLDRMHRQRKGVFQVSIALPTGSGLGRALSIAASLEALFPPSAQMVQGSLSVHLTQPMSIGPAVQESDRIVVPVSAAYQVDHF